MARKTRWRLNESKETNIIINQCFRIENQAILQTLRGKSPGQLRQLIWEQQGGPPGIYPRIGPNQWINVNWDVVASYLSTPIGLTLETPAEAKKREDTESILILFLERYGIEALHEALLCHFGEDAYYEFLGTLTDAGMTTLNQTLKNLQ